MSIKIFLIILFYLIKLTNTIKIQFSNPLQRFIYDDYTDTIVLASVNHIYSLNASDLSILSDINISSSFENENHCSIPNNKTLSSLTTNIYSFPASSYLFPSLSSTFNQLLLLINDSILICSTSNRGGSCQLRSLVNLNLLKNSSQRIVSSSPFYPSIGFISENNHILYLSNTYDVLCDPFYEIPTISGRSIDREFLSIINLNSGQSALQQSTYTLRLLNIRLIKEFFLYYLYGFEHNSISYFLTIQQSDIYHTRKHKLQTKILRFCQTLKQPIIKSYVEIPITCGKNYQYLVTAKFSKDNNILYGIFRNTTLANSSDTSHAVCSYSIDSIREAFFQTIKRCLVDGKGYRGLGYISPDTHCVSNKNLNEINHDYCPDSDDRFFQYPIGGHRSLEQIEPIIELNENVNFTAIEIVSIDKDVMILLGDDQGTIYTFQTSNVNEIDKQSFPLSMIIDLKLINKNSLLKNANLLVLTNNQVIKQNLSTCEQYTTCDECSNIKLCHWCSKEDRCTPTFECIHENYRYKKKNEINMCTNIERVAPETISLHSSDTQLEILINVPLKNDTDEYNCQFRLTDENEFLYYTNAILLNDKTLKCLPPAFNNRSQAVYNVALSVYHLKANLTFGYYNLLFINCSNFLSCSSCNTYSNQCIWNLQTVNCISYENIRLPSINHKRLVKKSNQCPLIYLQQSINRLAYNHNKTISIHVDQCNENMSINSCQLNDHQKRFSFMSSQSKFTKSTYENHLCLLECSFDLSNLENSHQISFYRPTHLDLSIEFTNKTSYTIPRTHIALYDCERMALNCTSCIQLDPTFGCVWCNNMCMFKNQTIKNKLICPNSQECLSPNIHTIEPLLLPLNGGTLVTIKGKNFDLFNLSIRLADVPCHLVQEESSNNRIVCQSGDAGTTVRTGFVHLKFGVNGPQLYSRQTISYMNPTINLIEPLIGIESGGTLLTIHGENLTLGNSHISVSIGNQSCQLLSISRTKIQCETTAFSSSMLNKQQTIKFLFDRQTKIDSEKFFTIVPNPILYTFDKYHHFQSFMSGGHQLVIHGENFHTIQNIRLEFKRIIFVAPLFNNQTHLIFLTPSIQELNINKENDYQHEIEVIIHLDHFNKTSSLIYINDPVIFELEPILQTYTNELIIQGINLTAIGHTKNDINIHIGCDLCTILYLQSDKIICQPPLYRPNKYSKTNRVCYDSEHPWIIVTIDNLQSHVGYMMYPKRIIILGIISGCLLTILLVILIVLIIVCIKIRYSQRKSRRRYLYGTGINPDDHEKEPYGDNLINRTYQKLQPIETNIIDSSSLIAIPIRSYIKYLQLCYYYYSYDPLLFMPSYDTPKANLNPEIIDQFQLLFENNNQFIENFYTILLKSNNKRILNNFLLTQRYHLKKLLQYNNDAIYFNVCILLAYDGFLANQINSLFFQLYDQLKYKIYSGPIDTIEQTCSYYSLNNTTILNDQSTIFNSIQLIVHIDFTNSDDSLLINVKCLTCDTITQVKQKILIQLNSFKKMNSITINECQLFLLTHVKSNNNSFSASSCSSSTTSSSNVPLAKKSLLTQFFFNRTNKYSTTTTSTLNDSYRDSISLLLNDIDNTNEQINHCKKLNTLQHYGVLNDGYQFKIILPNRNKIINYVNQTNSSPNLRRTLHRNNFDCQYCSTDLKNTFNYITSLPLSLNSIGLPPTGENDRTRYFHLLNHTYEEIGECGNLFMDNNQSKTYRLFETKSTIHSMLINLIETLFTNFLHSDSYLSELIEQYSRFLHIFYGHFVPFILKNMNCLFDTTIDKCLNSSLDILATIFQIACSCQSNEENCSLCSESNNNTNLNLNLNIQNCTLLFADEIQRVRLHYSSLERRLNNKNLTSEYSSTNTGINKKFELDPSIIHDLIEYSCSHAEEINDLLKSRSTDNKTSIVFLNLVQMYRSTART
ncbi:unnamed protein product [Rotaria magnacalcarata]|uniref:Sema domain-containing protein n=7 Tax=Rotaria magnacalcarata TaxID=392030 RepID=A0A818Y3N7_9BILA|nr:unnamed protein product [Rotaria magnacalcarata]CAF3745781.1 unnamed protein product [Rotaria magnacalcarata]